MSEPEQERSNNQQNPTPANREPGRKVDGNYIPTTDTAPSSPPPKPKK